MTLPGDTMEGIEDRLMSFDKAMTSKEVSELFSLHQDSTRALCQLANWSLFFPGFNRSSQDGINGCWQKVASAVFFL